MTLKSKLIRFGAGIIRSFSLLTFALVLTAADAILSPALAQQDGESSVAIDGSAILAPVIVDGRVLFLVRGISAYPAEKRARGIAHRIRTIAADRKIPVTALRLKPVEHAIEILAGNRSITYVFDADAAVEAPGLTRLVLAEVYRRRIATAIEEYRAERIPENLLRTMGIAAGATVALLVLLFAIVRGLRSLSARTERRYKYAMRQIEEGSLSIVSAQSIWAVVHFMFRALKLLAVVVLLYVYLHFVLALYPWTRILAVDLRETVLTPVLAFLWGLVGAIPNLVVVALIVLAARYVLRVTRLFFSAVREGTIKLARFDPEWADSTYKLARVLIIAFAVVVCYPYIPGSQSPAFKGVTIFLGVLFSIGSSSFLANVIAGYTMTYRRAFRVGDRIKVGDMEGDVTEVQLLVTRLRSIKNEEFVLPNSVILTSNVVNYSALVREQGLILHTAVGIGYETPWRQVEAMLLIAAQRTLGLLRQPPPYVLQKSLGDFAVTYELNVYCDTPSVMHQLYTDLHRNILDVFNEYHIQIMTPAYVADPATPKVVPKEQWFAGPAEAPPARKTGSG